MPLLIPALLPAVRQYLGLTKAEMGRYLGIPRERVADAERGARPLSVAAGAAFIGLLGALPPAVQVALAEGTPPPPAPATAEAPPDGAALRQYATECVQEAARLGAELARLRQRVAQAHARLALLPGLPPAPSGPLTDDAWPTRLERQARAWLAAGSPTVQALLTLRIAALDHAAAAALQRAIGAEAGS